MAPVAQNFAVVLLGIILGVEDDVDGVSAVQLGDADVGGVIDVDYSVVAGESLLLVERANMLCFIIGDETYLAGAHCKIEKVLSVVGKNGVK